MRKSFLTLGLCLICVAAFACSDGSHANPVAPVEQSSIGLTTVTGASHGGRHNITPVLLCHNNPDYATDGGYEWEVIEVDDNSATRHVDKHGDYTLSTCSTLGTLTVEADCGCCLSNLCGVS